MNEHGPIITKREIITLAVIVAVTALIVTAFTYNKETDTSSDSGKQSAQESGKPYAEATLDDSPFSEPVEFVTQLSDGQYLKCIRFDEDTTPVCDWNGADYPYFIKGEAYGPNGKMTRGEVEQWNTQHTNQLPYPDDGADDTNEADNNSTIKTTEPSYPTDANGPSSPTTQSNSRDSEDDDEKDDFL